VKSVEGQRGGRLIPHLEPDENAGERFVSGIPLDLGIILGIRGGALDQDRCSVAKHASESTFAPAGIENVLVDLSAVLARLRSETAQLVRGNPEAHCHSVSPKQLEAAPQERAVLVPSDLSKRRKREHPSEECGVSRDAIRVSGFPVP
jgi:hypothetical protein